MSGFSKGPITRIGEMSRTLCYGFTVKVACLFFQLFTQLIVFHSGRWKNCDNVYFVYLVWNLHLQVLDSVSVIQDLQSHPQNPLPIVYFFFDFTNQESLSTDMLLRSLLSQLCSVAPDHLNDMYNKHDKGTRSPLFQELKGSFHHTVRSLEGDLFVVLDGLDECPRPERQKLLALIGDIVSWEIPTLHVMLSSRDERDIVDELVGVVTHNVHLESSVIDHDIQIYIYRQLRKKEWQKWPAPEIVRIGNELLRKANGM